MQITSFIYQKFIRILCGTRQYLLAFPIDQLRLKSVHWPTINKNQYFMSYNNSIIYIQVEDCMESTVIVMINLFWNSCFRDVFYMWTKSSQASKETVPPLLLQLQHFFFQVSVTFNASPSFFSTTSNISAASTLKPWQ